jgi:hypothetical protein
MKTLTIDEIIAAAPSAAALTPHPGVSSRYEFIPTLPLIERLHDTGWRCISAAQPKKRGQMPNDPDFGFHRVRMAVPGAANISLGRGHVILRGIIPCIDISNSHNRSSQLVLNAGLHRLVCNNGLVIGIDGLSAACTRFHLRGLYSAALTEAIDNVLAFADTVPTTIERMSNIRLSDSGHTFALEATRLRYGYATPEYTAAAHPNYLDTLAVTRDEDEGDDLWHVFNRVQEALTQRNVLGNGRPLAATRLDRDFNRGLWAYAQTLC